MIECGLKERPTSFSDLSKICKSSIAAGVKSIRFPLTPQIQHKIFRNIQIPTMSEAGLAELMHSTEVRIRSEVASFIDLSAFAYSYWIEGATFGILSILNEAGLVYYHKYDYPWLQLLSHFKPIDDLNEVPSGAALYVSQPFSGLGRVIDLSEIDRRSDLRLFLDMAYWGTLMPHQVSIPRCTHWIAFSFSKNLGLWPIRIGLLLSRNSAPSLQALRDANYQPFIGIAAVREALDLYGGLYGLQGKIRPLQFEICNRLGVLPCDSVLIGQESINSYRISLTHEFQEKLSQIDACLGL